jgi:hypothetical protein
MGDMGIGSIVGGLFQMGSASIQAKAMKKATQMQIDAINQQRELIRSELAPEKVAPMVAAADKQRAMSMLALQGKIDPALLASRYQASSNILGTLQQPGGQAEDLASQLISEIQQPSAGLEAVKAAMIDRALDSLDAGATLPSDVQAEIIKAGLERSTASGVGAARSGLAGQTAKKILGQAGVTLQQQRENQAMNLTKTADELSTRRAQLLASVFPQLKNLQTLNLQNALSSLTTSNAMAPESGMSGGDMLNLLKARVGAEQSLTSQEGAARAELAKGIGSAWSGALGGIGRAVAGANSAGMNLLYNNVFGA